MNYFVTGATGFIGKFLTENLLKRKGTVYVLVRAGSEHKFAALQERFSCLSERLEMIKGDLSEPNLGISEQDYAKLQGKINGFFHLAAIYDMAASAESQEIANIQGTRHAVQAAAKMGAKCFNYTSSIAVAGLYPGVFREDMFEEAQGLNNDYLRTKHEAEKIVRKECKIPFRIYRPGMVVGHSKTGEMDKIDGPYFFFTLIKKIRAALPPWMPVVGIEGGRINVVPVDYVANAMDYLANQDGLDGQCFHLTDPDPKKAGEVLNVFCQAAHAPNFAMRIDTRMFGFIPPFLRTGITKLPPVQRTIEAVLSDLGIPSDVMSFINYPTKFDNRDCERALRGSGISCPRLEDYAAPVWDYWERRLDPELHEDRSLATAVAGKVIVITGASSGIGKAVALKLAETQAKIVLVARTLDKLEETKTEVESKGGTAFTYTCDVSDLEDCDRLVGQIMDEHGTVDILVNNAGRSIRRSINLAYDRFHDFERTMQLNYFGALRLIMRLLPVMETNRSGHIINISSIGVLTNAPRFSAYVASKAALDAFSRCAASEFSDVGISFTTINMPLVKTPMIAPTKIYEHVPTISPEKAADMITHAMIHKPKRVATSLGIFAQMVHFITPKLSEIIMNSGFKMFPDSDAAKGGKNEASSQPSSEQVAFAYMMKGIHW